MSLALLAACGDDDDDNGGDTPDDAANQSPDAGGNEDEDADDQDQDESGAGSDEEQYVADVCGAFDEFGDQFTRIVNDPENQDATEEEAFELFEQPLQQLVDSLDGADPPGDVEEFHDALVSNFSDSLEKVQSGDTTAFDDLAAMELPTPSEEARAKYQAIADENPDCAAAGVTFS
jgi:hypothetical protein